MGFRNCGFESCAFRPPARLTRAVPKAWVAARRGGSSGGSRGGRQGATLYGVQGDHLSHLTPLGFFLHTPIPPTRTILSACPLGGWDDPCTTGRRTISSGARGRRARRRTTTGAARWARRWTRSGDLHLIIDTLYPISTVITNGTARDPLEYKYIKGCDYLESAAKNGADLPVFMGVLRFSAPRTTRCSAGFMRCWT